MGGKKAFVAGAWAASLLLIAGRGVVKTAHGYQF